MDRNELGARADRERAHFDAVWAQVQPSKVEGSLRIPGIPSLSGKRILICSCGTGSSPVLAAKSGAEVYAVDISPVAVRNAIAFADHNAVVVRAQVMDVHSLTFPDAYFDIVYGSAVLHHLDADQTGREVGRVLRPGGVAYFEREPCDRNPILRLADRLVFGGRGRSGRRQALLFLRRLGTEDEAPLTRDYEERLRRSFPGQVHIVNSEFVFFQKLSHLMQNRFLAQTSGIDRVIALIFPRLLRFSYHEDILLRKTDERGRFAPSDAVSR